MYLRKIKMEINLIVIITLIIIAICAFLGYTKGFLKMAVSLVSFIASIILVNFIAPHVAVFLEQSTPVYDSVKEHCMESYQLETAESLEDALEDYPMADYLLHMFENSGRSDIVMQYGEKARELVADMLTDMIIQTASYVIAIVIVMVGFWVLCIALDIIGHIPVIKGINKIAGLLIGVLEGVFFVWIAYLIILMCSGYSWGRDALEMIYANDITEFLYDCNIILHIMFR